MRGGRGTLDTASTRVPLSPRPAITGETIGTMHLPPIHSSPSGQGPLVTAIAPDPLPEPDPLLPRAMTKELSAGKSTPGAIAVRTPSVSAGELRELPPLCAMTSLLCLMMLLREVLMALRPAG